MFAMIHLNNQHVHLSSPLLKPLRTGPAFHRQVYLEIFSPRLYGPSWPLVTNWYLNQDMLLHLERLQEQSHEPKNWIWLRWRSFHQCPLQRFDRWIKPSTFLWTRSTIILMRRGGKITYQQESDGSSAWMNLLLLRMPFTLARPKCALDQTP